MGLVGPQIPPPPSSALHSLTGMQLRSPCRKAELHLYWKMAESQVVMMGEVGIAGFH